MNNDERLRLRNLSQTVSTVRQLAAILNLEVDALKRRVEALEATQRYREDYEREQSERGL